MPDARLDVQEHYPKRTFRNRLVLATANGVQRLTLPVERRNGRPRPQGETMREVTQGAKHWRAVTTAYGAAPFFEEMEPSLEALFLRGPDALGEWNLATMQWAAGWLNVELPAPSEAPAAEPADHAVAMESSALWWKQVHQNRGGWPHVWSDRSPSLPWSELSVMDALLHLGPEARTWITPPPPNGFPRPE